MEVYHFKALKKDAQKTRFVNGNIKVLSSKPSADIEFKDLNNEVYKGIINKPTNICKYIQGYALGDSNKGINISGHIDVSNFSGNLRLRKITDKQNSKKSFYNAVITGAVVYDNLGNEIKRIGETPLKND